MTNTPGYRKVLKAAGGSQASIARLLNISKVAVHNWRGRIPVGRCVALERKLKGRVTRFEMRPDHFGRPPKPQREIAQPSTAPA